MPSLIPLLLPLCALVLTTGCQSQNHPASAGNGDGPAPAAASDAGADVANTADASRCLESPTPRRSDGTVLAIPVALQLAGKVMRFGEGNVAADGEVVTPLNVRFYLSSVALVPTTGGQPVPVDIVSDAGALLPYGVHFYNAEDPTTQVLRVRAPAGNYSAISFSFGLDDGCNDGTPARNPPLSDTSQMTWPHGFGFLFFRYEGHVTPAADGGARQPDAADAADGSSLMPAIPTAVHMGGWPHLLLAPIIHISVPLSVPPASAGPGTLRLIMDDVFKGANTQAKSALPIPPPGFEANLGENLRQAAPGLTLFVLTP